MASDVTINSVLNQQNNTLASSTQIAKDFDSFLSLLTTQLQNQDPLSPMDSTEFTNQLVAFSGVEQQINTNQKLDSLVSIQFGSIFSSAVNYVGLEANYLSAEANYDGKYPVNISYTLERPSAQTTINILDASGKVVFSRPVSDDENLETFVWNGETTAGPKAAPGTYAVRIDAVDGEGLPVKSSTVVSGRVRGVETQNGNILLLVGERAVPLGSVINVSEPDPLPPTST